MKTLIHLAISCKIETDLCARGLFLRSGKPFEETTKSEQAIKLAFGITVHASTLQIYREAGIFLLDKIRKLAVANYILTGSSVANQTNTEVFIV